MLESATSSIAQVHTPQGGIQYIAQARRHHGFVVQRRYRQASESMLANKGYYEAYLQPFLNPEAVKSAGLEAADILRWSAAHLGEIFTHEEYAALCLRWGDNDFGYQVTEMPEVPVTEQHVPFTPHTCWQSGLTYYQLALPKWMEGVEPVLLARLRDLAGLERHEWEIGQEGTWRGWYATDRAALENALASLGFGLALAQPGIQYGLWVQLKPGNDQRQLVAAHATTEEAWAHFCALPKPPAALRNDFPRAAYGCAVDWPGQDVDWDTIVCIHLEHQYALDLLANPQPWTGQVMPVAYMSYINETEQGLLGSAPFLAELLAVTGLTRPQQAGALGWSMLELHKLEKNPVLLTPANLEQVARLTGLPTDELTARFNQMLQAIEAAKQRQLAARLSIRCDL